MSEHAPVAPGQVRADVSQGSGKALWLVIVLCANKRYRDLWECQVLSGPENINLSPSVAVGRVITLDDYLLRSWKLVSDA